MEEKNIKESKTLWGQGEGDAPLGSAPHPLHNICLWRLILPLVCEPSREGRVLELPWMLPFPSHPQDQHVPTKGVETWQAGNEEQSQGWELLPSCPVGIT